jgi:citrate synthase
LALLNIHPQREKSIMKQAEIRSDIAWATPTKVVVHGLDLCEDIVGKLDFGQMAFLQLFARLPEERELRMFNAMMVILVEHGITPSSLATRMTYAGAPEAVQAAVAAGLLGLGSVFVGSLDNAARLLQASLPDPTNVPDINVLAREIVNAYRARKEILPGIGRGDRLCGPLHSPDERDRQRSRVATEPSFAGERDRCDGRGCIGNEDSLADLPWAGGCRALGWARRAHPRRNASTVRDRALFAY